jgi:PAS domain S-box-containing protein
MIGRRVWHWIRGHNSGRPPERDAATEHGCSNQAIESTAFQHAPVCIVAIDENNTILAFNQAASLLFGYAPGEVIGENIDMIMAGEVGQTNRSPIPGPGLQSHPSGRMVQRLEPEDRDFIAEGPELAGRKKDGSLFPMELIIAETHDSERGLIMTGVVYDLTDQD